MIIVAIVTLVTALMALLILGFLRVARELLSRGINGTPSCQDEGDLEQVESESSHWMPGMVDRPSMESRSPRMSNGEIPIAPRPRHPIE
jgi:hypothetical protein